MESMQIAFTSDELRRIGEAAAARDMTAKEFVRQAAAVQGGAEAALISALTSIETLDGSKATETLVRNLAHSLQTFQEERKQEQELD